ncbi:hypothetical protein BSK59_05555 [Paenibacillus odorifer]|uniref:hypothetical protein n=1 Tax=Paenibacillus odorifer TaxID=189426 RepID=UPI00096ECF03|nr:hypothetical protein [Paenibacillus odorifer]OME60884.1 hypothetical protein BSK59_05555 [Paenibacillus odorifer]
MLTIQCTSDIVKHGQTLSPFLLEAVSQEHSQLCEILNFDEGDDKCRLDTTGHTIICLEHYEPQSNLTTLGLAYPFLHVEYVEIYELPEVQYYRILLMYDNESFTTVFSVKGTQNNKLEEWLANQSIQGEAEDQ